MFYKKKDYSFFNYESNIDNYFFLLLVIKGLIFKKKVLIFILRSLNTDLSND